jgi:hypothetical protein
MLAVGGLTVLALSVMDTNQVVKTPSGLTVKQGQALAADMPAPPPPPVMSPVGKGKGHYEKSGHFGKTRTSDVEPSYPQMLFAA